MHPKNILLLFAMILCAGCGSSAGTIPTAVFLTATLPPTPTLQSTQTAAAPAPTSAATEEANISPVEGMTTTQLNVRAIPSTAGASLGIIGIFVKVQVIGKDMSGSWYQIVYAESEAGKGWVRAEYVQVNDGAGIRLVETASGPGSAVSGTVIQKVNVRSGPGLESELLGVLNSNDLVFITGRDVDGKWIQIEFVGAPDGKGWVTAEFLQATGLESVPQIGATVEVTVEATPAPTVDLPPTMAFATDGDSMQSPLAVTVLSVTGSRAIQARGNVSAPNGDAEDWLEFTSQAGAVSIQVTCTGTALRTELWSNGKPVGDFSCGAASLVNVAPGSEYFLRLIQNGDGYTEYVLNLEVIP